MKRQGHFLFKCAHTAHSTGCATRATVAFCLLLLKLSSIFISYSNGNLIIKSHPDLLPDTPIFSFHIPLHKLVVAVNTPQ